VLLQERSKKIRPTELRKTHKPKVGADLGCRGGVALSVHGPYRKRFDSRTPTQAIHAVAANAAAAVPMVFQFPCSVPSRRFHFSVPPLETLPHPSPTLRRSAE
jgi:hypothetical protein